MESGRLKHPYWKERILRCAQNDNEVGQGRSASAEGQCPSAREFGGCPPEYLFFPLSLGKGEGEEGGEGLYQSF